MKNSATQDPPGGLRRSNTDRTDGFNSRNRGLDLIDDIFKATGGPAEFIDGMLRDRASLDVLEVGFGWGIALLGLVWRFRQADVNFYGVDIESKPALATSEGIRMWAEEQGIFPRENSPDLKIPSLDFYDASTLQFADESMDFVYSAVTIRFMQRKIEFIEEVARVLRPGGKALLHIGESNWNYPFGKASAAPVLTPYTSRLVLRHADELVPLPDYFKLFDGDLFKFQFTEASRCVLVLAKLGRGRLSLDLQLDEGLTMRGRAVPLLNRKGETRGGMRSVYNVNDRRYRELHTKGILRSAGVQA